MDDDTRYQLNAVLFVGGAILAGKILSELFPDNEKKVETTREPRLSNGPKIQQRIPYNWVGPKEKELIKQIVRQEHINTEQQQNTRKFIIEVPKEPMKTKNPSGISTSPLQGEDRKYPPHYYSLSKSNQYKYRQRLAKDLIQISQEHIK